jgi:hypothetical protein
LGEHEREHRPEVINQDQVERLAFLIRSRQALPTVTWRTASVLPDSNTEETPALAGTHCVVIVRDQRPPWAVTLPGHSVDATLWRTNAWLTIIRSISVGSTLSSEACVRAPATSEVPHTMTSAWWEAVFSERTSGIEPPQPNRGHPPKCCA